jgi:hypothetical protein
VKRAEDTIQAAPTTCTLEAMDASDGIRDAVVTSWACDTAAAVVSIVFFLRMQPGECKLRGLTECGRIGSVYKWMVGSHNAFLESVLASQNSHDLPTVAQNFCLLQWIILSRKALRSSCRGCRVCRVFRVGRQHVMT